MRKKRKIDHGAGQIIVPKLYTENMTPARMNLHEGQVIQMYMHGRGEAGGCRRRVKIKKLYRHHALCQCGNRRECFTYAELAIARRQAGDPDV